MPRRPVGRLRAVRHPARLSGLVGIVLLAGACTDDPASSSPGAQRGRQVYIANCTACHNQDPAQPGSLGPPVKAASAELLKAKVVEGSYPPGYTPKRPTAIMQPMPGLAGDIPALAEFLNQR